MNFLYVQNHVSQKEIIEGTNDIFSENIQALQSNIKKLSRVTSGFEKINPENLNFWKTRFLENFTLFKHNFLT